MTDIQKHLPVVLSCIRQQLVDASTPEQLRNSLREILPASYGISTGCLVAAHEQQSQPLDVIIYDKTLALQGNTENADVRRTLAIIRFAHEWTRDALADALQDIASAKRLVAQPQQAPAQATQKPALKKLLPLGIVAFAQISDVETPDLETSALLLDTLLKHVEERLRPDYLLAPSLQLMYSNPRLTGQACVASTIHIARVPEMKRPRPCYVCKQYFTHQHFFYEYLCLPCGDLNYQKRASHADLTGRVALVTGGRVKIGYATALRLLRAGAQVIVTTRFPHDAARRYASEADFADWGDHLQIYGLDFRFLPVLEHFIAHLYTTYPALDMLINNAAQTVRYPLSYHAPLLPFEHLPLSSLPTAQQQLVKQSHESLPPTPFAFSGEALGTPEIPQHVPSATMLHDYGAASVLSRSEDTSLAEKQDDDTRPQQNSWTLPLDEIDLTEFLEVQVINVTAPFLLINRLLPLLRRSPFSQRFIINVSAVEGQFARNKQGTHVHTNMAKASLNMLTHTAAAQLARDHIFLNSVDPGWISQQSPLTDKQAWERIERLLPLDLVDAAARICDPIFSAISSGETAHGGFYKDYQRTTW